MGLDRFTLIAQVVNFLVLVWLLRHFLYDRIARAVDEREAKIASRLEDAAQARATAEREAELYRTRNREFDERRDQMLAEAEQEAKAHRERLMEASRLEAEAAQAQWFESLHRERHAVLEDLRERLGRRIFACARHALEELADVELEEKILDGFAERLRGLDPAERGALVASIRGSDRAVEVRTAFPVPPETRERLSQLLRQQLDDDGVDVRFAVAPELIGGVELETRSHRLSWNLDSYLAGLEAHLFEVLDERAESHATSQ